MQGDIHKLVLPVLLHLQSTGRQAGLISCHDKDLDLAAGLFEKEGFHFLPLNSQKLSQRGLDGDEAFIFVGKDQESADELYELYVRQRISGSRDPDWEEITGRIASLLGYPECCVKAFLSLERHTDDYLIRSAYYRTSGAINPLCLFLCRHSPSLLQHAPCRLNCQASLEIAKSVLKHARLTAPDWAKNVVHRLNSPLLFFDTRHYLPLENAARHGTNLDYQGLAIHHDEETQLDGSWVERFNRPGCLCGDDPTDIQIRDVKGMRIDFPWPDHPVLPILLEAGQAPSHSKRPSILIIETLPNEQEQAFSSFFPRLYSGDLVENGISVRYLQIHLKPGNEIFNSTLAEKAVDIARHMQCTQVYFFRFSHPSTTELFSRELPDVPRILMDNATATRSEGIDYFTPLIDRRRFIRGVLSMSAGQRPDWIKQRMTDGEAKPVWEGLSPPAGEGCLVHPDHPLNLRLDPERLNPDIILPKMVFEIASRSDCHYRSLITDNPHYQGIDLEGIAFGRGCAFCTGRTPWVMPVDPDLQLTSLTLQVDSILSSADGTMTIRIIDQGSLPILEGLLEHCRKTETPPVTWLIDLRVSELLAGEKLLQRLLSIAAGIKHRIDLFCIGFENFSQPELERFNKGIRVEENIEAVRLVDRLEAEHPTAVSKIGSASGFILFTPWTTCNDLQANAKVMSQLNFSRFRSGAIFTRLRLYRNSPIHRLAERDGLLLPVQDDRNSNPITLSGYPPEESWRFSDSQVDRVYRLMQHLKVMPGISNEAALLSAALAFVDSEPAGPQDGQKFIEKIRNLLEDHRGPDGKTNLPGKTDSGDDRIPVLNAQIETLENALKSGRDSFDKRVTLARLYVTVNNPEKALQHFSVARKQNPQHPDPVLRIAEMLILLGKNDQARRILETAGECFTDPAFLIEAEKLLQQLKRNENNGKT